MIVPFGGGAYVIHYLIEEDDTIVVVRIWHSREARR